MQTDHFIGIDIGSTCAKAVVLRRDGGLLLRQVLPTGWSSVDTAEALRQLLAEAGYPACETNCVATGYGRVAVPYAGRAVTEITCHARGACFLQQTDQLLVIDIGGQDTKIIGVRDGAVCAFLMNDKCSAGTGRFLEIMAARLALRPEELCALARRGSGVSISSLCTVFAESEVVSLIGRGEPRENIAFGVVDSIVKKVASQRQKLGGQFAAVCLTGGLCQCDYLPQALSAAIGQPLLTHPNGRFAGAIGAALCAAQLR